VGAQDIRSDRIVLSCHSANDDTRFEFIRTPGPTGRAISMSSTGTKQLEVRQPCLILEVQVECREVVPSTSNRASTLEYAILWEH
jgi:hypothetical protein